MKKTLLSTLAVAMLLYAAQVRAQDEPADDEAAAMKPLVVFSFSGYAEFKQDLEMLGEISDNPDMAKSLDGLLMLFTQGQGLAGLDEDKPWGAAFSSDGIQFQALAFLPVTDLQKLLDSLGSIIGEAEDEGDGIYHIEKDNASVFVKEQEGWAFLAQNAEGLADLPEDPLEILGGLNETYDLALQIHIQNIPEVFRGLATDMIRNQVGNLPQNPGESDEAYELRKQLMEQQTQAMTKALAEMDTMTVGWSIDSEEKQAFVDFGMTALEGSETAEQLANVSSKPAKVAGFLLPDAVMTLHANSTLGEQDIEQYVSLLDSFRGNLMEEIDADEDIDNEEAKDLIKDLVGQLFDVAKTTLEEGQINIGLAADGSGPFTVAAGALVADGEELEKILKKVVELAAADPDAPKVELDVDEHNGVKFHQVSVPVPDDDDAEQIKKLLGETLDLTVAIGPEFAFVALGPDGIATIKKVLDGSEDPSDDLAPFDFSLALAPVLKFASEQEDAPPDAAMMAESLGEDGKDHVSITLTAENNGVLYHIEVQEGVLRLIGQVAKKAANAGGVGGFE